MNPSGSQADSSGRRCRDRLLCLPLEARTEWNTRKASVPSSTTTPASPIRTPRFNGEPDGDLPEIEPG